MPRTSAPERSRRTPRPSVSSPTGSKRPTDRRLSTLAGLTLADIDVREQVAQVLGKGHRRRSVPFGVRTAQAISRYLRERSRHSHAKAPNLWLGEKGKRPLTADGIKQLLRRRGARSACTSIHTCSATDSPTPGCRPAAPRPTLRAPGRVEVPPDARPLRRQRRRRPSTRGTPPTRPRRPTVRYAFVP